MVDGRQTKENKDKTGTKQAKLHLWECNSLESTYSIVHTTNHRVKVGIFYRKKETYTNDTCAKIFIKMIKIIIHREK